MDCVVEHTSHESRMSADNESVMSDEQQPGSPRSSESGTESICMESSILTHDMIAEEAELRKVSMKEQAETKRQNMKKMRSLEQDEYYQQLNMLLTKSKLYTSYVHERIQTQREHNKLLEQQILKKRCAKNEAPGEQKKETVEQEWSPARPRKSLRLSSQSSQKSQKVTNTDQENQKLDENQNVVLGNSQGHNEQLYPTGTKIQTKCGTEGDDKIYTAKVLNVDDAAKRYFVHFDGWNSRHDKWINSDLIVGLVESGRRHSNKSPTVISPKQNVSSVMSPIDNQQSPPGSTTRRGCKRKFSDVSGAENSSQESIQVISSQSTQAADSQTPSEVVSVLSSSQESAELNVDVIQPLLLTGASLRPYQLDGFKWLKMLYENGVNGILADEMGLGKTIQCIALISHLIAHGIEGPFLVCGPLSTVPNWIDEFKRFSPKVPTMLYHGSIPDRAVLRRGICRRQKIGFAGVERSFPVVVTSYEIAMKDSAFLSKISWNLMIVDEGHRIKNFNCRLIKELKTFNCTQRLLLTGTPLQNNLAELWSLLNFLVPEIFGNLGSFEAWFDVEFFQSVDDAHEQLIYEEQRNNTLSILHQILTPFMLRRLKTDVDLVIPPKRELVVYAPMSAKQQEMYRSILDRTIAQLVAGPPKPESPERDKNGRPVRKSRRQSVDLKLMFDDESDGAVDNRVDDDDDADIEKWAESVIQYHKVTDEQVKKKVEDDKSSPEAVVKIQLRNSMALLRRCCNHPYLIRYPLENGQFKVDEELITSCGKLMLLDRMLKELKEQGHKVLVFSQSTQMLDILQDYCEFRKHNYSRLDGTMSMSNRQGEIGRFNEEEVFLFLISTRAGGLGINLTQADTVVIYDSDWNPQCDLQAQDRCHRIGQNRPVVVYRLVTANTVDQKIVDRAAAKRKLEKVVIYKGKFKSSEDSFKANTAPITPQELLELLQESDYQETIKRSDNTVISDTDLHQLLDRSDLVEKWKRQREGRSADETQSKKVTGVFHVLNEVWDNAVVKSSNSQ